MRLDRGRREHALGRAADPPEQVDAGALGDRQQRRRHVAVGDEADPRAGLADLLRRASAWRSRSSIITIRSLTSEPRRLATSFSVSPSGRSRSSRSAMSGPPAIFSM